MWEWLYDRFNLETVIGIVIAALVVVLFVGLHEASKESKRIMDQCIADGHKEYECHAMLDSHEHITTMPVVIPVRR